MSQTISVLLVDDDELVSACISAWLEDEGFSVQVAAGGEEALRLMATEPVDVALVDLQLQGMDGEEVIVRAYARHPGIRFLVHTGQHYYQLPARLLALGMQQQDVIYKPIFELDAFAATIRRLVHGVEAK